MIEIIGGGKTGYNLHCALKKNDIESTFYYFDNEYGQKKQGGKKVTEFDIWAYRETGLNRLIVSSETAFVYFREYLKPIFPNHYFLRDKGNYNEISAELSVSVIPKVDVKDISYPIFVKPLQSGENKVPFKTKIVNCSKGLDELERYIKHCSIQKYLSPKLYEQIDIGGYFTGSYHDLISFKEENQYPTGVAAFVTYHESDTVNELKFKISQFLNKLNYRGFVELEFQKCIESNKIYLMDINPRPWGSFFYYLESVTNLREVICNEEPVSLSMKKAWINMPRLILANINGNFGGPALKYLFSKNVCYEPYF